MFSGGYGGYGWINPVFFTGGVMALTSGHIYVGDVTNVAQDVQGFVTVLGSDGSATPAAGYIGQQLSTTGAVSANTDATYDVIATVTLTAGVWLCSGAAMNDGGGTCQGYLSQFWVKNATTSTLGFDWLQSDTAVGARTCQTFHPRVIVVASGDANKNVQIRTRTIAATEGIEANVTCVRIA